jgi:hypothetical protein
MKLLASTCVVFVAAIGIGCAGLARGKGAAEEAIGRFHELYNEGRLDDIWQDADPSFRAASTKEAYDQRMSTLQRSLGKVTATSNDAWNVRSINFKTTIVMKQTTVFEAGEGTESFTFKLDGEDAVLVGYDINLLTR